MQWVRTYDLPVCNDPGEVMPDWTEQPQNHIDRVRCPLIKGLSRDVVHTLHKSLVGIALMRMSSELAGIQIERSRRAIRETDELLERGRREGF